MPELDSQSTRRKVLQKSVVATGAVSLGGLAAETAAANGQKRGGRGVMHEDWHILLDEPWEFVKLKAEGDVNVGCLSEHAVAILNKCYEIDYHKDVGGARNRPDEARLCIREDLADQLDLSATYEFHSRQSCEGSKPFLDAVSFGPSNG